MNINEVGGATVYVGEGLLAGILGPDQFRFAEKVLFSGTLSTYTYHIYISEWLSTLGLNLFKI